MGLQEIIGLVANVIQIGSVIFAVTAFLKARAEITRYLKSRRTTASGRPWAIAVGLGSNIEGAVKEYLKSQGIEMLVEPYTHPKNVSPEDCFPILRGLLHIKDRLTQAGVTEVHLFYKGPLPMAVAIGAIMDNWVPVKVYEYTGGIYRLFMVLEKETVKGLMTGDVWQSSESLLR